MNASAKKSLFDKGFQIVPRIAWKWPLRIRQLYFELIYLAAYKPRIDPKTGVTIDTGQVVTNYSSLAARTNSTKSKVRNDLKKLSTELAACYVSSQHRNVIITIREYEALGKYRHYVDSKPTANRQQNDSLSTEVQKQNNKTIQIPSTQSTEGTSTRDMILRAFDKLSSQSETIAPCKEPSAALLKAIDARLKVHPEKDFWSAVFAELKANSYYHGNNDKGYVVTLDYLMQKGNAERVLQRVRQVPEETGPSCPKCKGAKEVDGKPCPRCDGRGYLIVKGR